MPIRDGGVADPLREIVGRWVDVHVGGGGEDAFLDDVAERCGAADLVREGLAEDHASEVDFAAGALVVLRVDEGFVLRSGALVGEFGGGDVHASLEGRNAGSVLLHRTKRLSRWYWTWRNAFGRC